MEKKRPKNLNLLTIHFPLPAIISILHRLSGVFLFLLIPVLLVGLSMSLTEAGFDSLHQGFNTFYIKAILWAGLIPFFYHLVAGIRHLLSDVHVGDSLKGGRRGAQLVLLVTIVLTILAGIWLW